MTHHKIFLRQLIFILLKMYETTNSRDFKARMENKNVENNGDLKIPPDRVLSIILRRAHLWSWVMTRKSGLWPDMAMSPEYDLYREKKALKENKNQEKAKHLSELKNSDLGDDYVFKIKCIKSLKEVEMIITCFSEILCWSGIKYLFFTKMNWIHWEIIQNSISWFDGKKHLRKFVKMLLFVHDVKLIWEKYIKKTTWGDLFRNNFSLSYGKVN